MPIFKATAKEENSNEKINLSFMYYFINEFGVQYGKILDDSNSVLRENTITKENLFSQNIESYFNSNYTDINWIGEAKFDIQTENIFNNLRRLSPENKTRKHNTMYENIATLGDGSVSYTKRWLKYYL